MSLALMWANVLQNTHLTIILSSMEPRVRTEFVPAGPDRGEVHVRRASG